MGLVHVRVESDWKSDVDLVEYKIDKPDSLLVYRLDDQFISLLIEIQRCGPEAAHGFPKVESRKFQLGAILSRNC